MVRVETKRLTPMAFPLWAGMLSSQLTTETFTDRLAKMLKDRIFVRDQNEVAVFDGELPCRVEL